MEFDVKLLKEEQESLNTKKELLKQKKEEFEKENADLILSIKSYENGIDAIKWKIEKEALTLFESTKEKKMFGGIGIQERVEISYDADKALEWAKSKDMFLALDTKSFEKAVEWLKLDFVSIDKKPKVTFPKEIKLEG